MHPFWGIVERTVSASLHTLIPCTTMDLNDLGWSPFFAQHFEDHPGLLPARVACQHRDLYVVYSEAGELTAEVPGKWRHTARSPAEFPAVGDWVGVTPREEDKATIRLVAAQEQSSPGKSLAAPTSKYRRQHRYPFWSMAQTGLQPRRLSVTSPA